MCKNVKIFGSLDATKNKAARDMLKEIPWVETIWISPFKLLDEVEEVPFLITDEGDRYFGIENIEYFVKVQLAEMNP